MISEIAYDPLGIFHRVQHLPNPVFLDSSRFHPDHGRYSLLGIDPRITLLAEDDLSKIITPGGTLQARGNPWEILDELLSRFRLPFDPSQPLFPTGFAAGFLNYEMGRWLERLPPQRARLLPSPEMGFGFYDVVLMFDHQDRRGWLISTGQDETGVACASRAAFRRDQILDEMESGTIPFPKPAGEAFQVHPLLPQKEHEDAVRKALKYIHQGDIYQVNLSHPYLGQVNASPVELYDQLRKCNPGSFSAYLDFGDGQILSSSPERFLRMERRWIQTRPIKGTAPRHADPLKDRAERQQLLQSEKNRAELLMITDLLRNDLGRISEFGSVKTTELACLEEYETVHHLVSTVEARLLPHVLHLDALAACFPGGSITGAPKIRAMEIIRELEPWGRGIYTGSLGYIGFNGISDFNICIRTLLHRNGHVCFHSGGGITADSDPAMEYQETLHKARGILNLWKTPAQQASQSG